MRAFRSPTERRAFVWILGVGALVAAFRLFLSSRLRPYAARAAPMSPRSTEVLPPLLASLWGGLRGGIARGPFWKVAMILALDAGLVLLGRKPQTAKRAHALLVVLLICTGGWTILMSCIAPLIADEPGIRGQAFIQFGTFFGLVTAVQWFSMKAAGELS